MWGAKLSFRDDHCYYYNYCAREAALKASVNFSSRCVFNCNNYARYEQTRMVNSLFCCCCRFVLFFSSSRGLMPNGQLGCSDSPRGFPTCATSNVGNIFHYRRWIIQITCVTTGKDLWLRALAHSPNNTPTILLLAARICCSRSARVKSQVDDALFAPKSAVKAATRHKRLKNGASCSLGWTTPRQFLFTQWQWCSSLLFPHERAACPGFSSNFGSVEVSIQPHQSDVRSGD